MKLVGHDTRRIGDRNVIVHSTSYQQQYATHDRESITTVVIMDCKRTRKLKTYNIHMLSFIGSDLSSPNDAKLAALILSTNSRLHALDLYQRTAVLSHYAHFSLKLCCSNEFGHFGGRRIDLALWLHDRNARSHWSLNIRACQLSMQLSSMLCWECRCPSTLRLCVIAHHRCRPATQPTHNATRATTRIDNIPYVGSKKQQRV